MPRWGHPPSSVSSGSRRPAHREGLARLPGLASAWALPALGVALVCFALPGDVAAVARNQYCSDLYSPEKPLPCHSRSWQAFAEMAEWIKRNTPEDAIVVTRKPKLFYFFSRRRGGGYPFTTDPAEMLQFLDEIGADYVVIAGLHKTTFRYLTPVIDDFPERFIPVARVGESDDPIEIVLRYRSQKPTANRG